VDDVLGICHIHRLLRSIGKVQSHYATEIKFGPDT
jgi:hypothetical protein